MSVVRGRLWLAVALGGLSAGDAESSEPSCNLPYPRAAVATILVRELS